MKQWCALYVFLYSYGVWLPDLDLHFEDQGGFRKQHSTENQNRRTKSVLKHPLRPLEGAWYGTLNHHILLSKLEYYKQRVLMHGHQGWNVRHGLCHIYMIYVYIWVVYSFCLFCCLFIIVTTQFVALYKPCKPKPKPSTYDPPPPPPPPPSLLN